MNAVAPMPEARPSSPHFSSGPCRKRPGWTLDALQGAVLGRSHRSRQGKAKLPTMRTIALEGSCFVLSACQYFTRGDGPAHDAPDGASDAKTVLIRGGSCIIDPLGNVLVEPDFSVEAIKIAEIDRRMIAQGKFDLDVVGHYARPDIFRLKVYNKPRTAVAFEIKTDAHA